MMEFSNVNRKRLCTGGLLAALLITMELAAAGDVNAEYVGPSDNRMYTSVADVLQDPSDDVPIALEGKLVKRVTNDTYLFSDSTGEIHVEIDTDDMPRETIDQHTLVKIIGEVDTQLMGAPEIEVDRVSIVTSQPLTSAH